MLASAACFMANVLLIRALGEVQAVTVWLVSCTRFVVGLALVATVYRRDFRPLNLIRHSRLAARGIVGGFTVCGYYLTIVHLGAGRASFINNTYVVFGALMAVAMLGERFRPSLASGGLAALAGLALLTNAFGTGSHASLFDLLGFLVALGSAYVVVMIRQLHATEHSSTIFAAQCAYGLLICAVPAFLHPGAIAMDLASGLMLLAALCSAAGQLAMTLAFRDLPVAEGTLLQMLVPLGIAGGGLLFFGEHFSPHEQAGAALILIGTALPAIRRTSPDEVRALS